jgi:hypothetical protein
MKIGIFKPFPIAMTLIVCASMAHALDGAAHQQYKVRQGGKLAYTGTVDGKSGATPATPPKAKPTVQAPKVGVSQDGFHFTPRRPASNANHIS